MYVSLLRPWYLVLRTMHQRRAKNYQRKRIVADDYDAVLEILSFWNKKFRKRFRVGTCLLKSCHFARFADTTVV